nr:unnamed protein product [Spirometra erinaceieuropaei]
MPDSQTEFRNWKCSINFDAFGRTAECQTYMSSSPNKYNVLCNVTFPRISLVFSHTAHAYDMDPLKDTTIGSSEQITFSRSDVFGNVHFELSYEDQLIGNDVLPGLWASSDTSPPAVNHGEANANRRRKGRS